MTRSPKKGKKRSLRRTLEIRKCRIRNQNQLTDLRPPMHYALQDNKQSQVYKPFNQKLDDVSSYSTNNARVIHNTVYKETHTILYFKHHSSVSNNNQCKYRVVNGPTSSGPNPKTNFKPKSSLKKHELC